MQVMGKPRYSKIRTLMSCVLTAQKKKIPIFLILLANWAFTFFPFLRSYVNLSTRNNLMGNLKQQSLSAFQFCEGRTMESSVHPLFLSLGFCFCCLLQNLGSRIFLRCFMSISECGLEAGTRGLQYTEFQSSATIPILNYSRRKRIIFLFAFV